jgi:hypothetical protein
MCVDFLSKCKSKVRPRTDYEGPKGKNSHSSTLSLTSALDGVNGQLHGPAALPPGKTWYPLYRRLGWHQGRSGRVPKISSPTGIRLPFIKMQPFLIDIWTGIQYGLQHIVTQNN